MRSKRLSLRHGAGTDLASESLSIPLGPISRRNAIPLSIPLDEAILWQKKAIEHPEAFAAAELEQVKQRLKLYEAHKPYREPRPEAAKTSANANSGAAGAGR